MKRTTLKTVITADWTDTTPADLVAAHLQRSRNTARNYRNDLSTFSAFMGYAKPSAKKFHEFAVRTLLDRSRGAAQRTIHNYVAWLRNKYQSLNTIRRKAMSIMGLLRLAHKFRVVDWALDPLKLPAAEAIRDTRGPGRDKVLAMLAICDKRNDARGARDSAMIKLMGYGAYRCNEILSLDVKHIDIPGAEIELLGKGLWGRIRHPMPMEAAQAIERWLVYRGESDGPLFTSLRRGLQSSDRLGYFGAFDTVRSLGAAVGIKCSPHKLRHFAATALLAQTNGNIPLVMAMTRHKDPKTMMIYNDERMIHAREAMELVASGVVCYRREQSYIR